MKLILRLVAVFLVVGLVSALLTQEVFAEKSEKEVANIIRNFFKHAKQGNAEAQNLLGEMYFLGKGVKQDYQEAAKWYRKAAEQGRANAQYNLGFMYENGQGVIQDYQEAAKWYRKAAEQGDANAQNLLGAVYSYVEGVEQDYQEASKWYRKAAEQGDANAQYNLGFMHENGQGVIQDRKEAAKWYGMAAEQGYAYAQNNLGLLYENGQGVLKDDIMAYALFNLAAVQGSEEARNNRALLKTKMSQNQIAEAQRLSRQLLAKIESTTNDKTTKPDYIIQDSNQIKSTGTGFVINTNAHIVTNHHVISDCKRIEIINSKINSRAKVLFADEINDLAVIKSNSPVNSYAFLRGGRGIRVGADIITVGYPLGTTLGESVKVTTGNISSVTGFANDTTIMQITAPIQLGNSGGPVLDMSGNVVGVVSAKINELAVVKETGSLLQNINLAIKSQTLQMFLDAHQIDYKMKNSDTKSETADIVEAAQEYTIRVTCYE
jgi:TPR repeat protein